MFTTQKSSRNRRYFKFSLQTSFISRFDIANAILSSLLSPRTAGPPEALVPEWIFSTVFKT